MELVNQAVQQATQPQPLTAEKQKGKRGRKAKPLNEKMQQFHLSCPAYILSKVHKKELQKIALKAILEVYGE